MSLLEIATAPPDAPVLLHDPVELRPPALDDYDAWSNLRRASRIHLTRWEPDWADAELTPAAFRRRVRGYWREIRHGSGLPYFVVERGAGRLVGGLTLAAIRYGASRSATVGYWTGCQFLRRGFAMAAVAAALAHAFGVLRLNRVEAACQPENVASANLLERTGFQKEGRARDYLLINGAWRDHDLFAITSADYFATKR